MAKIALLDGEMCQIFAKNMKYHLLEGGLFFTFVKTGKFLIGVNSYLSQKLFEQEIYNMKTKLLNIEKLPKRLYKYFDFNNKHHLRALFEGEIYMASPAKFNDIYDCKIPVRYDLAGDEYLKSQIIEIIQQSNKETPIKIQNEIANMFVGSDFFKDLKSNSIETIFRSSFDIFSGLFCLSQKNDNLLMWGHYAKNHSGFCIGYDIKYLLDIGADYLGKVSYSKDYPIILPNFVNDENLKKQVFTKSKDWKYEKEYRLFYKNISERVVQINKDAIKEIYLGVNVDKLSKDMWIKLINKYLNHVKVFECVTEKEKFKIGFKRII